MQSKEYMQRGANELHATNNFMQKKKDKYTGLTKGFSEFMVMNA